VKTIFCRDFWITFTCGFGGDLFVCDYETDGPPTARELKRIVEANIGKSLASIGEMELQASSVKPVFGQAHRREISFTPHAFPLISILRGTASRQRTGRPVSMRHPAPAHG
jgi:hypothetical protein